MPITIDLEKNPLLREMIEQVRRECTIQNIVLVLQARFGNELPSGLNDELRELWQHELDEMLGRCATATTLEEALLVRLKCLRRADVAGPNRQQRQPEGRER
jgi:hypothetical protein